MYLKSLEIQGFKSFPDKTVLSFSSGITAIVGPNGSGKSNIVDAIRWVLGEQSTKTLRGAKMEDVIFGGTQRRKPLGYCEVTLTVDNSEHSLPVEYDEVAITRRYYRSGESEFFINKKSARLKDIHELLMDTGLGREGYSLIGQGRIDEILAVKSADRREIFEEAAGITRFRYRKEEAQRRLAGTEENLVRIRDIITELEGQVGPLEAQAQKARRFLLLRDELRVLEATVWLHQLDQLAESKRKAQVDHDNAQRMLSARKRELDELYQAAERLTAQMRDRELEAEEVRVGLRNIETRLAQLQSEGAVLQANWQNNRQNAGRLEEELREQEGRQQMLLQQRQAREEKLAQWEQQRQQLAQQEAQAVSQAKQQEEQRGQMQQALEGLRAQMDETRQQMHQLELTAAALRSGVEEVENRGQSLADELARAKERVREETEKGAQNAGRLEQGRQREQDLRNMVQGFVLRGQARQQKAQKLAQQQEDLRRKLGAVADRCQMLQSLEQEYEGFGRSVKQTLQAADKGALQGIRGPVSRLIAVEDAYAVAIEIALGGAMSHIVTQDEESAKAAIQYLKARQLGRATFLPLTAVRPRETDSRPLEGQPGFVGMADRLVTREAAYDGVVKSLLGSTAVVDTIDSAIRLSRRFSYRYRMVTLDGQLINPSGAMTGGSLNKSVGMLSRANEISRLVEQRKQLAAQVEELGRQLSQAKAEWSQAENDAQAAQEELRQAQNGLLALEAQQGQHALLLRSLEQAYEALVEEQSTAGQRTEQIKERIGQAEAEKEQAKARLSQLGAQAMEQAQALDACTVRQSQLLEQLSQLRTQQAQGESQRAALQEAQQQLDSLLEALGGDRTGKEEELERLRLQEGSIRQAMERQKAQLETGQHSAEERREALEKINQKKLELEGQRVQNDKAAQEKNSDLLNLERERARLETKKNQAEMEERQILDKMWENYELTPTTARALQARVESQSAAQKRIGQLRGEIKKLGDVSLSSIEEFEKVNERYQFLEGQRKDLEQAIADLQHIIQDLTHNMEQIFAREFVRINEHFGQTFVELFGGGQASLQLEDEKDILNCGIEIRVELPGKSQRAISLLSGGEKALVAIVLYFAILKVRPTPFCVLDEIEAALDDVNVQRYVQYLRGLCGKTQFILITHRRGTMEGADILYGVTMQEQGVTKLLQLELNEVEKKIHVTPK